MKKFIVLSLLCFVFIAQSVLADDQVVLKNGDRVSGKIIKIEDDKITIETPFAGIITISRDNVVKVLKEQQAKKEVEIINAKYEKKSEDALLNEGKTEGANSLENAENLTLNKMKSATRKRGFSLTTGWDGAANVGFSFTSGNSKTSTFTAGVRGEKASVNDKWTVYANSLWNRNKVGSTNVTTSNAVWGGLRYDRNITKKVFVFGSYDFERDRPQKVNFRSVLGAGLGYHAIKNDKTELDLFGGAAWNNTWYIGPNKSTAEVLVGNSLKHKFNDRVKFQQGFILYPSLSDSGEYRFVFDSTLTADVTKRIGWFVTIADRYNSFPLTGVEKNDFLFATGLKWSFGKTK